MPFGHSAHNFHFTIQISLKGKQTVWGGGESNVKSLDSRLDHIAEERSLNHTTLYLHMHKVLN